LASQQDFSLITGVQGERQLKLFGIVHALDAHGLGLRLAECGQEHSRQDGDDGDDDQQFDQRESALTTAME
jgi:hypothetical protein